MQDALYQKASSNANPSLGLLKSATYELDHAGASLAQNAGNDGLTVQYLQAIAGARFGMVVTAQFLHEVYCGSNKKLDRELEREVRFANRKLYSSGRPMSLDFYRSKSN